MTGQTVFFSAGEVSGDRLAAGLVRELGRRRPEWRLVGIGGPAMAAAGCGLLLDISRTAAVGISESLRVLPAALLALVRAKRLLKKIKPDIFVAVDCQGINLILARAARRTGARVVYYIPPQNFLWHDTKRGREIARRVDLFLNIYRAGHDFYSALGARSVFCGHPLTQTADCGQGVPQRSTGGSKTRRIVLAAGSRPREIARFVPLLARTARLLLEHDPKLVFVAPMPDARRAADIAARFRACGIAVEAWPASDGSAFAGAAAALVKSGTITLEAALAACPYAVFYRISRLSWFIMARLWRVSRALDFISLPNILAGDELAREFLQQAASPERLASEVIALLDDPALRRRRIARLASFREILATGAADPHAVAARAITDAFDTTGRKKEKRL